MKTTVENKIWVKAAEAEKFPRDGGACVKIDGKQIAVFNFSSRDKWYAVQNECPHRQQMILSRGMIGDSANTPKVACPFHKKTFSLEDGTCLNDDTCDHIKTYPIKIEHGNVFVELEQ